MTLTNLVAKTLGSNDGDLITDSLIGLEIEGQLWVVTLNDDLGGLLDSLSANATHFCGICRFGLSRNWLGMRCRERNSQTFDMVDADCGRRLAGTRLGPQSLGGLGGCGRSPNFGNSHMTAILLPCSSI